MSNGVKVIILYRDTKKYITVSSVTSFSVEGENIVTHLMSSHLQILVTLLYYDNIILKYIVCQTDKSLWSSSSMTKLRSFVPFATFTQDPSLHRNDRKEMTVC